MYNEALWQDNEKLPEKTIQDFVELNSTAKTPLKE